MRVARVTAATFAAEVGRLSRFSTASQLVGFSGLSTRVARHSAGQDAKTGDAGY
jgi:hypothetical protein